MRSILSIVKNTFLPDLKIVLDDLKDRSFPYYGTQIFHGHQGQGKSLAMVKCMKDFKKKYPDVLIISNLKTPYTDIHFENYQDLFHHLRHTRNHNRENGTVFAIDEIQNYFNSHDSKSIPMWVFKVFAQQRKAGVCILATVQIWEEVTKTIRSQILSLVDCKKLGYFHFLVSHDNTQAIMEYGEMKSPVNGWAWFWRSRDLVASYDTNQIIDSGREQVGQISDFALQRPESAPQAQAGRNDRQSAPEGQA